MTLFRSFIFWLYMAAVCAAGGAVLVVSASGAVSELKHLHACSGGLKSTNDCRLNP